MTEPAGTCPVQGLVVTLLDCSSLSDEGEPKIVDFPKDAYDYTSVTFEPDLHKFCMNSEQSLTEF